MTTTTRSHDVRTFVVAHDLSSFAEHAADTALNDLLDSHRGGRIVLVHVVEVAVAPSAIDFTALGPSFAAMQEDARVSGVGALERVAERLRKRAALLDAMRPTIAIEGVVRLGASAADGVLEEATALSADRVYVGTHGRRGLDRLVIGSVAERVARRAEVPVVVVHGTRADDDELQRAA